MPKFIIYNAYIESKHYLLTRLFLSNEYFLHILHIFFDQPNNKDCTDIYFTYMNKVLHIMSIGQKIFKIT